MPLIKRTVHVTLVAIVAKATLEVEKSAILIAYRFI